MRILSITAQKPHSTGSGVYLTELVKGFSAMGHEQAVIAGICRDDCAAFPEGVRFFPVYYGTKALPFPVAGMSDEMPYESTVYSEMTAEMARQFRNAFLDEARHAIEVTDPHVIICHHLYLLTALIRETFPDRKVVGVCHGTGLRQLRKTPLERAYIREWIARLDCILALHAEQKKTILELFDVDEKRIAVVGAGYNGRVFWNMGLPKPPDRTVIVYAGKLSEKKGVMSLIRCLDQVKGPLELQLAGGAGNEAESGEIRALAERCAHPVRFFGRLGQEELARVMNQGHLFVLPSFYEGLPLVLIEALACGLNVVATDLPGVQDWLNVNLPGNGIRFVTPPVMRNTDEPDPADLPRFESALAAAITKSVAAKKGGVLDLRQLSWDGVCERILASAR